MSRQPSEEAATLEVIPDFSGLLQQGEFAWGIVSETGIVLKDDTTEAQWLDLTKHAIGLWEHLGRKHLGLSMKVADLLNWGEEHLGESFTQAIDLTRKSLIQQSKTVENWQRVFAKIPPSRRRETLTYSHHEAVAALDATEQDELLKTAETEGWTVKALREEIKTRHPRPPRKKKEDVTKLDNEQSALQKLIDVSNWLSEHVDDVTEEWKEPLHKCEKAFRRVFRGSGHKR